MLNNDLDAVYSEFKKQFGDRIVLNAFKEFANHHDLHIDNLTKEDYESYKRITNELDRIRCKCRLRENIKKIIVDAERCRQ